MEGPSASKYSTTIRGDDEQVPFRDGIRVDGERKHEPISEGEPERRPIGTSMRPTQRSFAFY